MAPDFAALLTGLVEVALALLFGLATVWIAVRAFDRMTPGLDELAELRRGNPAVGLLLAAVVLAVALVVRSGVTGLAGATVSVAAGAAAWGAGLGVALVRLLVAVGIALLVVRLALWAFQQVTATIDESTALAEGNTAVAALLGAVLVAVALVVGAATDRLLAALAF